MHPCGKGVGGGGVELICVIINFPGFWSYLNCVSASVDRVPKQVSIVGSIVQPTFSFVMGSVLSEQELALGTF